MSKIHIITDSASDITEKDEQELNIRVIPFQLMLGDKSYTSRVDFDNEGFYKLMEENPDEIPKTSQVTPFEFEEIYKEEQAAGYEDIILILINAKGSATYSNAIMARDNYFEDHPEQKESFRIHIFDGIGYTGLYGYPAMMAADMVEEGKTAEEICAYLKETLPKRRIYFGMYGLKYAAKSGRIPSAAAFVGDKLNIKPIMKIADNEIVTATKCRGENKMITKIIEETLKDVKPGTAYQVVYGSQIDKAEMLAEKLTEAIGYGPDRFFQIGAVIAANAGPVVVGSIFEVK